MDKGANLSLTKLDAHHCFCCGGAFDNAEKKKTQHHAIPKNLKPKRNVLLPICDKCHKEINQSYMPKTQFDKLLKRLDSFQKQADGLVTTIKAQTRE